MNKPNSVRAQFRSFPRENQLGTDGINSILISDRPVSVHSRNAGNARERTGTDGNGRERTGTDGNGRERTGTDELTEPKQGMFFHSLNDDGTVNHQGCLLALTAAGFGRAQLFEWFWGEPSTVIKVDPDYLCTCVFYASAAAMNIAYERWEADHE